MLIVDQKKAKMRHKPLASHRVMIPYAALHKRMQLETARNITWARNLGGLC
jgi:hypothetical protein